MNSNRIFSNYTNNDNAVLALDRYYFIHVLVTLFGVDYARYNRIIHSRQYCNLFFHDQRTRSLSCTHSDCSRVLIAFGW